MVVVLIIVVVWVALSAVGLVGWNLLIKSQQTRAQSQLDHYAAVDLIASRAHTGAMEAFTRVTKEVQEENRAMLRELTDLIHGPAQDLDVDLDQPDPTTEMTGPFGGNVGEFQWLDPTDAALPDEELVGRGPTRAAMESDIVIDP